MTEQDQRIAIAEACGAVWRWCSTHYILCIGNHPFGINRYPLADRPPIEDSLKSLEHVPNYLRDLNATQKVVIDLICGDVEKEKAFLKAFNDCIGGYADSEDVPIICEWDVAMLCAPAWVWTKAVLVAIGKWHE